MSRNRAFECDNLAHASLHPYRQNLSPLIEPDSMCCDLKNIRLGPLRRDAQLSTDGERVVDRYDGPSLALVGPGGNIPDPVDGVNVVVHSGEIKSTVVSRNQERDCELNALFREGRSRRWCRRGSREHH